RGEVIGIVGESGCGKTMLALSLIRLLRHPARIDGGRIVFSGRDLLTLPESEMRKVRGNEIGFIFQDPSASLNPVMTVGRQIGEAIEAHNAVTRGEANRRAVDMLRSVRIPEAAARAGSYPHQYSGGMRQRVGIAIGTANRPQLIVADEPTTALDVTVQAQIIQLLATMNRDTGTAIIFISHNIALVSQFCSRVLVMYAGRIIEQGPTAEVFERPAHPYTAALLKAVPRVDMRLEDGLATIEGRPPDLARKPDGCAFQPRCPARMDICCEKAPPQFALDAGRTTRCWLAATTNGADILSDKPIPG
ncbi:ABC transporter ATP-binding protein, partial [Allorhizobium pseudoryzae]|uniref:ABC transporter ATP-binding protein n=1 Tax=Allorhizobium pseudoryzae TaxID=379684 RepID=UPI003CFD1B8C